MERGALLTALVRVVQEHRHSFVRKNAVMAVFTIYKNFEFLIPDAPELIQTFMVAVSRSIDSFLSPCPGLG